MSQRVQSLSLDSIDNLHIMYIDTMEAKMLSISPPTVLFTPRPVACWLPGGAQGESDQALIDGEIHLIACLCNYGGEETTQWLFDLAKFEMDPEPNFASLSLEMRRAGKPAKVPWRFVQWHIPTKELLPPAGVESAYCIRGS